MRGMSGTFCSWSGQSLSDFWEFHDGPGRQHRSLVASAVQLLAAFLLAFVGKAEACQYLVAEQGMEFLQSYADVILDGAEVYLGISEISGEQY